MAYYKYNSIYKQTKGGLTENGLWKTFSKFIRLRDTNYKGYCLCISCSTIKNWQEMDAGHFIPVGSCYGLKYNEDNAHAQCTSCNRYKSGNLIDYRIRLVDKIGEEKVKKLELIYSMKKPCKKYNQNELKLLNNEYKKKIEALLKEKCL